MRKYLLLLLLLFNTNFSYTQEKSPNLSRRMGLIISYWNEPYSKSGAVLGLDWEFLNNKGHGVSVTFPQFLFYYFPNNHFSLSLYPTLSYRFVHPKNGFYTSLTMGVGLNIQWKTVPVYNIEGYLIKDPGFYRMIAVAQWDVGYDFETVLKAPLRLFASVGWNGVAPNNLGINSHLMFQIGLNIKLKDI